MKSAGQDAEQGSGPNHKREVMNKVAVILETHERELLAEFVELLYRRVVVQR